MRKELSVRHGLIVVIILAVGGWSVWAGTFLVGATTGDGRAAGIAVDNSGQAVDPVTGAQVPATNVGGKASTKNGKDNAIRKQFQKWVDAGTPPDGKIQPAEWKNVGKPATEGRKKPASEKNPFENKLLAIPSGPGIPGPWGTGDTVRLCVSFGKWNDDGDGEIEDNEYTENAKIYVPEDGLGVPPPTG